MKKSRNGEGSHTRALTDTTNDGFARACSFICLLVQGIAAAISRAKEGEAVCQVQRATVRPANAAGATRTVVYSRSWKFLDNQLSSSSLHALANCGVNW